MASPALLEKIKVQGDLVRKLKAEKAPKEKVNRYFRRKEKNISQYVSGIQIWIT